MALSLSLETPFLEGGIASTNFFNGRLLSGEDLTREQQARRAVAEQLGRAIGDGVAYGLWVTAPTGGSSVSAPTVTVQPGLAVNRLGQPLELPEPVDVSLIGPVVGAGTTIAAADGGFGACAQPSGGTYVA